MYLNLDNFFLGLCFRLHRMIQATSTGAVGPPVYPSFHITKVSDLAAFYPISDDFRLGYIICAVNPEDFPVYLGRNPDLFNFYSVQLRKSYWTIQYRVGQVLSFTSTTG